MKELHRFHINGRVKEALVLPNDTLLELLRYTFDLIGTKQGCDKGDCGACTVLIDGQPVLSCLTLALLATDKKIITIEGMATSTGVDILVEAFDRLGALQCGFCQPGMILSAKALLKMHQKPSLRQIQEALSGNLCRCTGYTKIYAAVLCASLVMSNEAKDLEEAMAMVEGASGFVETI